VKGRDHFENLSIDENIEMDLKNVRWKCVNWIHLAQDQPGHGFFPCQYYRMSYIRL
jgi:hypothetical protein